ncbi:MAG TPA: hypothetical protein ENK91_12095 [Bacteroidetes bacterium]|nr:hypothetical protein [Bacteroidota bacterium]
MLYLRNEKELFNMFFSFVSTQVATFWAKAPKTMLILTPSVKADGNSALKLPSALADGYQVIRLLGL